jgi:hypothetical protein
MKKHFRATEYYTSYNATEPVELDSDWFPDFKGTTEEEFFNYIVENHNDLANDESFSEEVKEALWVLIDGEKSEYFNSCTKFYDGDIQMGVPNEEYHRSGYFEVEYTTNED